MGVEKQVLLTIKQLTVQVWVLLENFLQFRDFRMGGTPSQPPAALLSGRGPLYRRRGGGSLHRTHRSRSQSARHPV